MWFSFHSLHLPGQWQRASINRLLEHLVVCVGDYFVLVSLIANFVLRDVAESVRLKYCAYFRSVDFIISGSGWFAVISEVDSLDDSQDLRDEDHLDRSDMAD
jgi:hypothetical protein